MNQVYFSLGSNVGNRRKFLDDALAGLREKVADLRVSSYYRTEPWGNQDQPEFLNLCAAGQTLLSPAELLRFLKEIEAGLGRRHTEKWGPREIDIDILFYGSEIIKQSGLRIPHPHLAERTFVLVPLAEIAPDFVHPVLNKTIKQLSEKAGSAGINKLKNE